MKIKFTIFFIFFAGTPFNWKRLGGKGLRGLPCEVHWGPQWTSLDEVDREMTKEIKLKGPWRSTVAHRGPCWVGKNGNKLKSGQWSSVVLVGKNQFRWNVQISMCTLHPDCGGIKHLPDIYCSNLHSCEYHHKEAPLFCFLDTLHIIKIKLCENWSNLSYLFSCEYEIILLHCPSSNILNIFVNWLINYKGFGTLYTLAPSIDLVF